MKLTDQLRRLRDERGSIMTSLLFVLVASATIALISTWFMARSSQDYQQALQARAKASVKQTAQDVLGLVNTKFPDNWRTMTKTQLNAATATIGDDKQLQAKSKVDFFDVNDGSGVVTIEITGTSTQNPDITTTANMKLVPTGAAVFTGLTPAGRPTWVYGSESIESLAVWEIAPNSLQFIDEDGNVIVETPTGSADVTLEANGTGATVHITDVYCTFGATTQYQFHSRAGDGEWGTWSNWKNTRTADVELTPGERIEAEARARCVSGTTTSLPNIVGAGSEYVRPLTVAPAVPSVSIAPGGTYSWGSVRCEGISTPMYSSRYGLTGTGWLEWTPWTKDTSGTAVLPQEGQVLNVEVIAKCVNDYLEGPESEPGTATTSKRVTSTVGTVELTRDDEGTYAALASETCAPSTDDEYLFQRRINNGEWEDIDDWSSDISIDVEETEGSRTAVRAKGRCGTEDLKGPQSNNSNTITTDTPFSAAPEIGEIRVTAGGRLEWDEASCPTGTTAHYSPLWRVNGGSYKTASTTDTSIALPGTQEGDIIEVSLDMYCEGYVGKGPTATSALSNYLRPFASTPTLGDVTIALTATGAEANWPEATGCPAGSAAMYSYAIVSASTGEASEWTSFDVDRAATFEITPGDSAYVMVEATCQNTTSEVFSDESVIVMSPLATRP